jgi:hypothetical protein
VISSLFACSCNDDSNKVLAQDNIWENVDRLKVDIDNVIDFTADGKYFYFLTDKEIIKVDGFGKTISTEKHENVTGICWDEEAKGLHKILKNCVIVTTKGDSIRIDTTGANLLGSTNAQTRYLAFNGDKYFTCISLKGFENHSGSDQIIIIDNNGNNSRFTFYSGIPCGLNFYIENLYYISKNSNEEGTYQKFGIKDTINNKFFDIPFLSPVGFHSDKNNFNYSFSNKNKILFKFKEE